MVKVVITTMLRKPTMMTTMSISTLEMVHPIMLHPSRRSLSLLRLFILPRALVPRKMGKSKSFFLIQ